MSYAIECTLTVWAQYYHLQMAVGERQGLGGGDSGAENDIRHWDEGTCSRDKSVTLESQQIRSRGEGRGRRSLLSFQRRI